jgi:phage shock protein A
MERMREAVERKEEEAQAHAEHQSLDSAERPQEAIDPREKSSGHKKKTADKWNQ